MASVLAPRAAAVWLSLALGVALAGCAPIAQGPTAASELEVATLADAAPLVDAGSLTAHATWLEDDGVRHTELADPADATRPDWRVLAVWVTDAGEQMLFVPPDQFDELADADIAGCAPGA